MYDVIPTRLWIGNALDARNTSGFHEYGIVSVVDLAYEESPATIGRDMMYCRFPLVDGDRNSEHFVYAAVSTTATLIRMELPTLVACHAGMSRSPAVVAAALAIASDESPEHCLKEVTDDHPHDVSPKLWADVKHAYDEIVAASGTS